MSQPRIPNTTEAIAIARIVTIPIIEAPKANPLGTWPRLKFINIVLKTSKTGDAMNTTLPIISDAKPHWDPALYPGSDRPIVVVEATSVSMICNSGLRFMRRCRPSRPWDCRAQPGPDQAKRVEVLVAD